MIAAAALPLVPCTLLNACLGHYSLKRKASPFFRRPSSCFRSVSRSPPSVLCDCLVDQNGSHHQLAAASTAEAFIKDKLTNLFSQNAGSVRQIVLVTDEEDCIPNWLQWPPLTVIFHVSSHPVIQTFEVPKTSLVRYVHGELEQCAGSGGWTDGLRNAGYQGHKPSVWVVQGINLEVDWALQRILENMSTLVTQSSMVIGSLSVKTAVGLREDMAKQLLEKKLMGSGFRMKSSIYKSHCDGMVAHMLFEAEQLRLSDDQVEYAKREMELAEESGDEETFEDWL